VETTQGVLAFRSQNWNRSQTRTYFLYTLVFNGICQLKSKASKRQLLPFSMQVRTSSYEAGGTVYAEPS